MNIEPKIEITNGLIQSNLFYYALSGWTPGWVQKPEARPYGPTIGPARPWLVDCPSRKENPFLALFIEEK